MLSIDAGTFMSGIMDIVKRQSYDYHNVFPKQVLSGDHRTDAWKIAHDYVATCCITHPHLDHIAGLVINSASFCNPEKPKIVAGLRATIDAMKQHVFNGKIWPNLSNEGENPVGALKLDRMPVQQWRWVADDLELLAMPISHGPQVDSTAFFMRCRSTNDVIGIWGDVEPDAVSHNPRNQPVWDLTATEFVRRGVLKALFIECSYPSSHGSPLFGHMTPKYLVTELRYLAQKSQSTLQGIKVIITHIKDKPQTGANNGHMIYHELKGMVNEAALQCDIILAKQGLSLDL